MQLKHSGAEISKNELFPLKVLFCFMHFFFYSFPTFDHQSMNHDQMKIILNHVQESNFHPLCADSNGVRLIVLL